MLKKKLNCICQRSILHKCQEQKEFDLTIFQNRKNKSLKPTIAHEITKQVQNKKQKNKMTPTAKLAFNENQTD